MQILGKTAIRYKLLLLFLAILAISACHSDTSQLKQNQTYLTIDLASTQTQIVNHALGEVEIPVNPQRVVILHDGIVGSVLELGFRPIGIAYFDYGGKFFRGIPPEWLANIPVIGGASQPSLEAILQIKPDLILGVEWQKIMYKQLSAIAPTVLIGDGGGDHFFQSRYLAQILGKSSVLEKLHAEYEQKIKALPYLLC